MKPRTDINNYHVQLDFTILMNNRLSLAQEHLKDPVILNIKVYRELLGVSAHYTVGIWSRW
jgi:hypothetical protein